MKKTIQINIAGIIFNIEEDAYQTLSTYLKSVQQYFATYEGSEEIISDIEYRIAEKFIEGQKPENAPVITQDKVNEVIKTMGTVEDFAALEEEEDLSPKNQAGVNAYNTQGEATSKIKAKLYRDNKRKVLGGVLAGLAHHWKIDVTWLRIIFLVMFLGLSPITETGISGILFLIYIVFWAVIPNSFDLEEDPHISKFYRNPEGKILGGVSSGLSAYFDLDVALIRIGFVLLTFFFGVGIITYLILWIAAPEAKSITQKMEMKGEPVTLENIKSNISNPVPTQAPKKENAIVTLLLLPFRVIGILFSALGRVINSLGPIVRVFFGIILLIIGFGTITAAIAGTTAIYGLSVGAEWVNFPNPVGMIINDFPPYMGLFFFLFVAFPAVAIFISGLILVNGKRMGGRQFWLTGLALWLIGLVGLASAGTKYGLNFTKQSTIREMQTIGNPDQVIFLDVAENIFDDEYNFDLDIDFETSKNGQFYIEKEFTSQGPSSEKARISASKMSYNIIEKDSVLLFDAQPKLAPKSTFRAQRARITLHLPENKKVRMSNRFASKLAHLYDMPYKYGFEDDDYDKFTYSISKEDGLVCNECEILSEEEQEAKERMEYGDFMHEDKQFRENNTPRKKIDISDFDKIEVSGTFVVLVRQGSSFEVEVIAENEQLLADTDLTKNGDQLKIAFEDKFITHSGEVHIYITMPKVEALDITGASKLKLINFKQLNNIDINLSGSSWLGIDAEANKIAVEASGASQMELFGEIEVLDTEVSGASTINAQKAKIKRANVSASGASQIKLGDVDILEKNTSGASEVSRY